MNELPRKKILLKTSKTDILIAILLEKPKDVFTV